MELKKRIRHGWDISARGYSDVIQDELDPDKKIKWLEVILDNAPQKDDLKILDVGCGPGFFSMILSEAGFDVTGIDFSAKMIEEAEKNTELMETEPVLLVMDTQDPDFPDDTFDLIVSRNVVWCLSEPEKAYNNWLNILAPGGVLEVFDGDYLKDLREPDKNPKYMHDSYAEEYKKLYGKEPKCSFTKDMYPEARGWRKELPLVKEKRPDWDVGFCKKAGYADVKYEWVNDKVFSDERDIYLHKNNPYFLLTAKKPD